MEIEVSKDEMIAILNSLYRSGETDLIIKEKWHEHPLLVAELSNKDVTVSTISKSDYVDNFPKDLPLPDYGRFILDAVKGGGILGPNELKEWDDELSELTCKRNIRHGDRLLWFYYDTSALMSNIFFLLREHIPSFLQKVNGNNISGGVQNELEEHQDKRFREQDIEYMKKAYSEDASIFLKQPMEKGRISWLADPELTYIKKEYGTPPTSSRKSGDSAILDAYFEDIKHKNVDGVIVTCDQMMRKRARSQGMNAWLVELKQQRLENIPTRLEYLANSIYRMAIIFGAVQINNNISINGIWKYKTVDDWINGTVKVNCPESMAKELQFLQTIMKTIPQSFLD